MNIIIIIIIVVILLLIYIYIHTHTYIYIYINKYINYRSHLNFEVAIARPLYWWAAPAPTGACTRRPALSSE